MQGEKKFLFSAPVLKGNHSLQSRWYIEWKAIYETESIRLKRSFGINEGKTIEERQRLVAEVLANWDPAKYWPRDQKEEKPLVAYDAGRLMFHLNAYFQKNIIWKERTQQTYRYIILNFYTWLQDEGLESITPRKFTVDHARAFLNHQLKRGKISHSTYNARKAFLFSVFDHWRVHHPELFVKVNPFEAVQSFPENKTPQKLFSEEDKKLLIAEMEYSNPGLLKFINYIYFPFLRPPAEIQAMRIHQHDFRRWTITIPVADSKTNRRRIHVIPTLFQPHLEHLKKCPQSWFVFGRNYLPGPLAIGKNRVMTDHRQLLDRMGFNHDYSLYSWRHTAAVDLYLQTRDIRKVQQAMQHTTIATTERYLRNLGALQDPELFNRQPITGTVASPG